jgi:hypothetical protein
MSDDLAASLLLVLRLKAFAPTDVVACSLQLPAEEVQAEMSRLADRGWVQHREGMAAGWSLTTDGRHHGQRLLRAELDAEGTVGEVEACYRGFLPLNGELLSICTDWQTVEIDGEHLPNDHSDPARDAAVLARLDSLHARTLPVLDALADALGRFGVYRPRLSHAHEQVRAGNTEWIAKPTLDSYHGTWFELHEHLLVTLGRERATESLPQYVPTQTGPEQHGERT